MQSKRKRPASWQQRMVGLLDGVRPIVELWPAQTPAQKVWRQDWLRKQLKAINDFERRSRKVKLMVKQANSGISKSDNTAQT
jgi:hypothetical protein